MVSLEDLKKLREDTGISLAECKKALEEASGDLEKAKEILRKKGAEISEKKALRKTEAGIVEAYIHPNKKIGVLLDLRCETDFVAFNEKFKSLAHDLCLQIAATSPKFIQPEDISEEILKKEEEIYRARFEKEGKPKEILEKIVKGYLEQYKKENSLLTQPFIKDETKTVKEIINGYISLLGENIVVARFTRYEL